MPFLSFLKNILFIYSWETQREMQRHRQREKQAPCREPDVGLDPRTPGSRPESKEDAQSLSHAGAPTSFCFNLKSSVKVKVMVPDLFLNVSNCNRGCWFESSHPSMFTTQYVLGWCLGFEFDRGPHANRSPAHWGTAEENPSATGLHHQGPRIESHIRLPARSLLLSLPVSLPLSPCLSWINK